LSRAIAASSTIHVLSLHDALPILIDMPVRRGFGDTHVRPSASVAITTNGRGVNPKQMVEAVAGLVTGAVAAMQPTDVRVTIDGQDRKSTRLNSSHVKTSYAVFCLK